MNNKISPADSNQTHSSGSMLSRRSILQVAGLGALGLGLAGILTRSRLNSSLELSRELFGTLEDPKFQVTRELPAIKADTYSGKLQPKSNDITVEKEKRYENSLKPLNSAIGKIEEFVKKIGETPNERDTQTLTDLEPLLIKIKSDLNTIETDLGLSSQNGFILSSIQDFDLRDIARLVKDKSFTDKLDELGTPENFVRRLVKEITSLDLPADVALGVRSIDEEGINGISTVIGLRAESEDAYYLEVVLTLAHESGHLMSAHQEEFLSENKYNRSHAEISAWEEACAYAFESVTAAHLKQQEVADGTIAKSLATLNRLWLLEEYYSRSEGYLECHREGMAIFDAALTVLKDFGKAYNFLSTHTQLTPEMTAVMESNRNLYLEVESDTTPRADKIRTQIEELKNRLQKVTSKSEQLLAPDTLTNSEPD